MPACAMLWASSPASWRPSKNICPPVAGKCPLTTLMKVDLPEPLGPSRPRISPSCTCRLTPSRACTPLKALDRRSEEHTSELQSLMRISYAVFCLKKKTTNRNHTYKMQHTKQPIYI